MDKVLLAHGGGGRLSQQILKEHIAHPIANPILNAFGDSALLEMPIKSIAFTTDSYVVTPPIFPGGDIGRLAVNGTINDLSVAGATPLYMSLALILEEGFPLRTLDIIMQSIANATQKANVNIVTGDTKVVNKGAVDGIFINTSGIGVYDRGFQLSPSYIQKGDVVIVSGTIGDHGAAVMISRQGLNFEHTILSDTAPLNEITKALTPFAPYIRFMRDPTRGGLATTLNEIVSDNTNLGIQLEERKIPVREEVFSAFEILGLDAMHVANEGKLVLVASQEKAREILDIIQSCEYGKEAVIIGHVTEEFPGKVFIETGIGGRRLVTLPEGELLPRIC